MREIGSLFISSIATAVIVLYASTLLGQEGEGDLVIKNGSVVTFEYTLAEDTGKVIESDKGQEPLIYKHGNGQIIRGLEKELAGMKVAQEKNVRVNPDEGYGAIDPKGFREVPRATFPLKVSR